MHPVGRRLERSKKSRDDLTQINGKRLQFEGKIQDATALRRIRRERTLIPGSTHGTTTMRCGKASISYSGLSFFVTGATLRGIGLEA